MPDLSLAFEIAHETTIDDINTISARLYELSKETPAKAWWDADPMHPAICRALRLDPAEQGAVFAKAPFRLAHVDDQPVILAAYPAPRCLGPVDGDWLGVETVLAWNPRTDAVTVMGDGEPHLVGRMEEGVIYGSARDFFTAWLQARAQFFVRWVASRQGAWKHGAIEHDMAPGVLAVGDLNRIRWQPGAMPQDLSCVGVDPRELNRLLLKAARVPRVRG